eukprot:GHVP01014022.1.p1 GENE.GHVP01014022.1~~GHVP01014022.1.p1  ORF type:complete len:1428 (+),score=240.43 GHVP01014022.1:2995-7278(+)
MRYKIMFIFVVFSCIFGIEITTKVLAPWNFVPRHISAVWAISKFQSFGNKEVALSRIFNLITEDDDLYSYEFLSKLLTDNHKVDPSTLSVKLSEVAIVNSIFDFGIESIRSQEVVDSKLASKDFDVNLEEDKVFLFDSEGVMLFANVKNLEKFPSFLNEINTTMTKKGKKGHFGSFFQYENELFLRTMTVEEDQEYFAIIFYLNLEDIQGILRMKSIINELNNYIPSRNIQILIRPRNIEVFTDRIKLLESDKSFAENYDGPLMAFYQSQLTFRKGDYKIEDDSEERESLDQKNYKTLERYFRLLEDADALEEFPLRFLSFLSDTSFSLQESVRLLENFPLEFEKILIYPESLSVEETVNKMLETDSFSEDYLTIDNNLIHFESLDRLIANDLSGISLFDWSLSRLGVNSKEVSWKLQSLDFPRNQKVLWMPFLSNSEYSEFLGNKDDWTLEILETSFYDISRDKRASNFPIIPQAGRSRLPLVTIHYFFDVESDVAPILLQILPNQLAPIRIFAFPFSSASFTDECNDRDQAAERFLRSLLSGETYDEIVSSLTINWKVENCNLNKALHLYYKKKFITSPMVFLNGKCLGTPKSAHNFFTEIIYEATTAWNTISPSISEFNFDLSTAESPYNPQQDNDILTFLLSRDSEFVISKVIENLSSESLSTFPEYLSISDMPFVLDHRPLKNGPEYYFLNIFYHNRPPTYNNCKTQGRMPISIFLSFKATLTSLEFIRTLVNIADGFCAEIFVHRQTGDFKGEENYKEFFDESLRNNEIDSYLYQIIPKDFLFSENIILALNSYVYAFDISRISEEKTSVIFDHIFRVHSRFVEEVQKSNLQITREISGLIFEAIGARYLQIGQRTKPKIESQKTVLTISNKKKDHGLFQINGRVNPFLESATSILSSLAFLGEEIDIPVNIDLVPDFDHLVGKSLKLPRAIKKSGLSSRECLKDSLQNMNCPGLQTRMRIVERWPSSINVVGPANWLLRGVLITGDAENVHTIQENRIFSWMLHDLVLQGIMTGSSTHLNKIIGTPLIASRFGPNSDHSKYALDVVDKTVVLANKHYWQFKIGSPKIIFIRSPSFDTSIDGKPALIYASSIVSDQSPIALNIGQDHTEPKKDQSWNGYIMSFFRSQMRKKSDPINVFVVSAGKMYERMLRIMMLSASKHTNSPLKFWVLDNYLSPEFKQQAAFLTNHFGFEIAYVTYGWPSWLKQQNDRQRTIWAYKILFLDILFPPDLDRVIYIDSDQVLRNDLAELMDLDLKGAPYAFVPFCEDNLDSKGYMFWKDGYWKSVLGSLNYHISALFVVDLKVFRENLVGDHLRKIYQVMAQNENSLNNLDQDLVNYAQLEGIPIFSLPEDWLWCETWCSSTRKQTAKAIDLCNNPGTKEPKLGQARRIISEWVDYDTEIQGVLKSGRFENSSEKLWREEL